MYNRSSNSAGAPKSQTLCVFNYPEGMSEDDLYASFPNALSITSQQNGSSPSCLIKFQSDADCQAAFNECQNGKVIGGRPIQAQLVPAGRSFSRSGGGRGSNFQPFRNDRDQYRYGSGPSPPRHHGGGGDSSQNSDCVLTLRNLAWSVTEDDLYQEFPRAVEASIKVDERNRSRGFGTVTFANANDCRNAESECSDKSINGRQVRAEIGYPQERSRDDDYRGGRGRGVGGRPFYDRFNNGGGRRGGYSGGDDGPPRRRFDDVDGGRSWGGGGGGGFGGQRRGGGGGFFERDRGRERSPGRRTRGAGGSGGGGARITSAVIRRTAGDSSDSDFDNRG
ncbi:hypothetical protein Aperf_G00000015768 [Anoplocephala perfoliata]